ncbi:aquaporin AQPAn.G-like isoform X2 [Nymphalis io]|uniref:aquaporin AQPAn.G-like isoform X2 n=1 Tax=Inachis io TaxID=171585 RepID=UPI0021696429|nr:aquaporin AQPAn.G-like isoform X2 [Nymphalis io]
MEEPHPVMLECDAEMRPLDGVKWRGCDKESRCELWRVAAAEACGTTLLVLLSCMPVCATNAADAAPSSLLQRSLAAGLLVALIVQCFDHVSGAHLNPTVTLAAALSGRVPTLRAIIMCVSQLVGGVLGAGVLHLLAAPVGRTCVTKPASFISIYQALAIETVLGLCLALANLASWDARNRHLIDSWPLRIGFIVAALSLTAGDLTGASMNPVRSFAPALLSGEWQALWVYVVGPLCGSCASVALYVCVWRAPPDAPARDASPPPRRRARPSSAPGPLATATAPHKAHHYLSSPALAITAADAPPIAHCPADKHAIDSA